MCVNENRKFKHGVQTLHFVFPWTLQTLLSFPSSLVNDLIFWSLLSHKSPTFLGPLYFSRLVDLGPLTLDLLLPIALSQKLERTQVGLKIQERGSFLQSIHSPRK